MVTGTNTNKDRAEFQRIIAIAADWRRYTVARIRLFLLDLTLLLISTGLPMTYEMKLIDDTTALIGSRPLLVFSAWIAAICVLFIRLPGARKKLRLIEAQSRYSKLLSAETNTVVTSFEQEPLPQIQIQMASIQTEIIKSCRWIQTGAGNSGLTALAVDTHIVVHAYLPQAQRLAPVLPRRLSTLTHVTPVAEQGSLARGLQIDAILRETKFDHYAKAVDEEVLKILGASELQDFHMFRVAITLPNVNKRIGVLSVVTLMDGLQVSDTAETVKNMADSIRDWVKDYADLADIALAGPILDLSQLDNAPQQPARNA